MPMPSLLQRLKERKLVQWALAYLAGGFVVLQVLDAVAEPLRLTVGVQQGILILLAIGFFLTLVLAWHHGEKGRQRVNGPELLMITGILVIAGAALSRVGGDNSLPGSAPSYAPGVQDDGRPSIAVLPFADQSPNEADAYFARGMHSEILSKLVSISTLKVTSNSTVARYRDQVPSAPQLVAALGVRYLVEGDVRIAGGQVRVSIRLVDGERDEQLWSNDFDRGYSSENLIAIQSDIALEVSSQLAVEVDPVEASRIAAVPTPDDKAYESYLRGVAAYESHMDAAWSEEVLGEAQSHFERAIATDPQFATAYAWLSKVHLRLAYFELGDVEDHRSVARATAEDALRISPGLPEAHRALVLYYHRRGDRELALRELDLIESDLSNDPVLLHTKARILEAMGRRGEALPLFLQASELEPLDPARRVAVARASFYLRSWEIAEEQAEWALAIEPGHREASWVKAMIPLHRDGDPDPYAEYMSDPSLPDVPWVGALRWESLLLAGDFQGALEILEGTDVDFTRWYPRLPEGVLRALTLRASGNSDAARPLFDSMRTVLEAQVLGDAEDGMVHLALGIALAGLGISDDAVREGKVGQELFLTSHSHIQGQHLRHEAMAWIYSMLGESELALEQLELVPYGTGFFEIDPRLGNLRREPAFRDWAKRRLTTAQEW